MKTVQSIYTAIWFDLIWLQSQEFLARKKFSKLLEWAFICSKLQADENIRGGLPLLVTLKSWLLQDCSNSIFSSKSPWSSPVPLKFQSYNLQHCKKNCRKLVFQVFSEQLLYHIIFGRLHCCDVSLVKKYNKPLLQKGERNIFDQKRFHERLIQSQWEKKLGYFEIKSFNV